LLIGQIGASVGPLGPAPGRTQIVQFGMPSGDRRGNHVAVQLGGNVRAAKDAAWRARAARLAASAM